jgi:hypothetical protein
MGLRLNGDSPKYVDIVFEKQNGGDKLFIKVEDDYRNSVAVGQWVHRTDGTVALRIRKEDI